MATVSPTQLQDYVVVSDTWRLYTVKDTDLCTKDQVNSHVPHGGISAKVYLDLVILKLL